MEMLIMNDSAVNQLGEYAKKLIGVGTNNPPEICFNYDDKEYYYQIDVNHEDTGTIIAGWADIDEDDEDGEDLIEAIDRDIVGHYDEIVRDTINDFDDDGDDVGCYRSLVRDVRTRIPDYLVGEIDEKKLGL